MVDQTDNIKTSTTEIAPEIAPELSVVVPVHNEADNIEPLIGEIQADGQFDVVWQTEGEVIGDAWSDFIPESAALTADWTYPWICGNCKKPTFTN